MSLVFVINMDLVTRVWCTRNLEILQIYDIKILLLLTVLYKYVHVKSAFPLACLWDLSDVHKISGGF